MNGRFKGPFAWTVLLVLLVVGFLVGTAPFPPQVQIVPLIAGATTFVLLLIILAGDFIPNYRARPEASPRTVPAGKQDGSENDQAPAEWAPWPVVLRIMGYAVGFFLFVFLFGFFIVPPVFVALFLIIAAGVRPVRAVTAALVVNIALDVGMLLLNVEVWPGVAPEMIEGYVGGAIIPPL